MNRPAQRMRLHAEAREEVDDVEPAVGDEDARLSSPSPVESWPAAVSATGANHEPADPPGTARSRTRDEHLGAQEQQHDTRDHRRDLVEAQRADRRKVASRLSMGSSLVGGRAPLFVGPVVQGGLRRHTR